MSYCIMNVQKMKAKDFCGKQKECNREYTNKEKYNGLVDIDKSKDNIYLVKNEHWLSTANKLIKNAGIKARKDAVKGISIVFDASPDWDVPLEEKLKYFEECKKFAEIKYGKVISSVIHMDEQHIHMHTIAI